MRVQAMELGVEFPDDSFDRIALSPLAGIAAGSRVQTRRGEVVVESLTIGEDVLTPRGDFARVKSLSCSRARFGTGRPASTVRIRQDAFGPMQPHRDVVVAPGQMLITGEGPTIAEALLGGERVVRASVAGQRMVCVQLEPTSAMMVDGIAMSGCEPELSPQA